MSRLGRLRWGRLGLPGGCGRSLELWLFCLGHPTLGSHTGGEGGVSGPGRGQKGDRCSSEIPRHLLLLLLLLLVPWVPLLRVVLLETDVPGQAADGRHRLELVDDVPRDEVDVIVAELQADVADAFSPQLVQLGVVHPLDTLGKDPPAFALALPVNLIATRYFDYSPDCWDFNSEIQLWKGSPLT